MLNMQTITILFLKDLFLSRWMLFAYLMAGIASIGITFIPNKNASFVGFLLVVTASVGMGMHMISELILEERKNHTLSFIMSLPVNILEYSIAKLSVVLTAYLIPWSVMLVGAIVLIAVLPWAKHGTLAISIVIFLELLAAFTIQLAAAVISESIGWTIAAMVGGNVFFNLFLVGLFQKPEIAEAMKSETYAWPPIISQILGIEIAVILIALTLALAVQSRKRSFI